MKTIKDSYLRQHILNEVEELKSVLNDETKHLSDVAMSINYRTNRISALNTLLFQEHREENKRTFNPKEL